MITPSWGSFLLVNLIPHGHCYLWKPELVGLHVVSDASTALAYYTIPASLLYFVRKRRDLPFSWAFLLFAAFIIACGTTHLMEIWTLWHPNYWVAGGLKGITAIVSIATATLLLPLIPQALALPSPADLEATNQQLQREIAERKRLEKERDGFFKLSPDLLCIATFDGYFQYINDAWANETGYTIQELLNQPYLNVIHPDDRAGILAGSQKVISGIDTRNFESRIQCKDGCIKWFSWSASAAEDEQVTYVIGRNITERKHVEEILQKSETRFRHLIRDLHVGVLVQGPNTEILLSNPQALELLGLTEDQLLGRTSFDLGWNVIYEDGAPFPAHLHPVSQAIATGQPVRNVVMGVYRPLNDDRVWLLVNAAPQLDESGCVKQVICTFSDISERQAALRERKAAEEKLRQQHELLQTIMNHVPVMISLIDPEGKIQWANRSWEKVLGWSVADLQQRDLLAELYPDPVYHQSVIQFIQAATGKWQDFKVRTRHGTVIDAAWANVELSDGSNIGIGQDITERKLAEVALRESEVRFRQIAATIQEVFWIATIDFSQILYISPAYETIWGRSCANLYEQPMSFIYSIHPADRNRVITTLKTQRHCGFDHEYRIVRPDGNVRWIWERASSVCDEDGTLCRVVGVSQDITERKLAETALRQQAERERLLVGVAERIHQSLELEEILTTTVAELRQLLGCDRVIIYRFNPDWSGNVVAESVRSPELSILGQLIHDPCFAHGWHEPYLQGRVHTIEDIETSDAPLCYRQLLASLRVRANLVIPILHETSLWGLLIAHHCLTRHAWKGWEIDSLRQLAAQLTIAIQQSELYRQVQQFNNHLERQVQEQTEQLQRSLDFEALLKRITDNVRDSLEEAQILQTAVQELAIGLDVYSCDAGLHDLEQGISTICCEYVRNNISAAQGKVIQLCDRPEIYSSLLRGETLQFSWMPKWVNPIRPTNQRVTVLACPIVDDQAAIGDLWLYRSGEQIFTDLEVRLVQQVANQCAIGVRQARLYQAAQAQVRELERLNHLKDDFLSTVSHELRTPMSNIKMATQMLEIILKPLGLLHLDSGSAVRYFRILQNECEREISLINDLLDLSRLESGVEPLAIAPVDLKLWIPYVLEPFEERTRALQQHLQFNIPEQLPFFETDLSYLERILTELLTNACKYTPSEETILLTVTRSSNHVQLSVSNSGVEIPASELPHIFEKFHRVPTHDPWKHGGTGLGLALVKRCVKQLHGEINVTSENGWTTFTLTLPWKLESGA